MMDFKEATEVTLPFGEYEGQTIEEVAKVDEGLRYLDWLVDQYWVYGRVGDALRAYLSDTVISKEVEGVVRGS